MALSPGTRFGQYEIADEIGAGGMGVVYRATDTTLDRDVAIKVLPDSMASDAERIARFDREAKTLASLNHPNIAQIYGLEKANGATALIMELVDGETLADRIAKDPLPPDEALGIAMQIADALEVAHGQNIVHRDLKPANVKLRSDGTVKVLDFGIAKALEPENLASGPQSPMMTTPATMAGVILGTAAYMSPEQAKGKAVDQRTDVWAFGVLLYEMLTGQLAFGAEDVPTTLARVIANETNLDTLPAVVSPAVRKTIELCLQKDPSNRLHAMGDVRLALKGAFETSLPLGAEVSAAARPMWSRPLPVSATVIVGAVLAGFAVWIGTQPGPRLVNRFTYELPPGHSYRANNRNVLTLSPDGRHFVYNTTNGLYLRTMAELEPRLISGTEPLLSAPIFSPDGQSVAYAEGSGQLKRIAISGGAPVVITDNVTNPTSINWEADGTIFFPQDDGIYRVSASGGTHELAISDGEFLHGPRLLPDGDSLLFSASRSGFWNDAQIVAQSLSTGDRTVLVEGGSDARYVPTGHLVYSLEDGLFAVRFDLDNLTVSGGAVPVVQGLMRGVGGAGGPGAPANYSVSENGTLVYATGSVAVESRVLVWVDREGREELIEAPPRAYASPRISPDGTKIALNSRDQESDIWTWDLARETLTRLTFDPLADQFPVWSPDGLRIAFYSLRESGRGVYWRAADGTGSVEQLAESQGQAFPVSFVPDGTGLMVRGATSGTEDDDIAIIRMGEERATPMLATTFIEWGPEVSPDGQWLAYTSNESGRPEIYVRPFPDIDAGGRWQVSTEGGSEPLWARNGRELFYRNGDALMAVDVQTNPSFTADNPEVLFEDRYFEGQGGRAYDVSPDDERFLMIKRFEDASEPYRIVIVQNWFEELKRLAPVE